MNLIFIAPPTDDNGHG